MYLRVDPSRALQPRLVQRRQGDVDVTGDRARHLTLQRQGIAKIALVALRPNHVSGRAPDQFGSHSRLVALTDNRCFDDRIHLQFPRNHRR